MRVDARAAAWVRTSRYAAPLLATALFAMLATIFLWPAIGGHRMLSTTANEQTVLLPWSAAPGNTYDGVIQSDQTRLSLPLLAAQQRAYVDGTLPFWDPDSYGGGAPLYADFSTGQAYPPRVVTAWLFSPATAHLVFVWFHLVAGALLMCALARELGLRWLAAVLAGSTWMFDSWNMGWLQLAPISVLVVTLPWCVLAVLRAHRRGTWRSAVLAGVPIGAALIAGHALFGVVVVGVAMVYAVCLAAARWWRDRGSPWPAIGKLVLMPVAGLALWAVALVPLALTAGTSGRAALPFATVRRKLMPAHSLLGLFWPPHAPTGGAAFQSLAFTGFLTIACALVGLFTRGAAGALGRGVALVMLAVMTIVPLAWLVYEVVPGMGLFRPYQRLTAFMLFGVVVLGVTGADRVLRMLSAARPDATTWLRVGSVVLILLNAGHLLAYARVLNPPFPARTAANLLPATPVVQALQRDLGATAWPGRMLSVERGLDPNAYEPPMLSYELPAWFDLESAAGYNSSAPARTWRLLRVLTGEPVTDVLRADPQDSYTPRFTATTRFELLARMGYTDIVMPPWAGTDVSWGSPSLRALPLHLVYAGPDGVVWHIDGTTPGPQPVTKVTVVADDAAALAAVGTDDAGLVLTADQAKRLPAASLDLFGDTTISGAARGINTARFTVTSSEPGLVVIPINWDPGWHATVGGHDVPVVRGDYNHVVIAVPAGTASVALRYRPPGITVGLVVSILAWLGLGVLGAERVRRWYRDYRGRSPVARLVVP